MDGAGVLYRVLTLCNCPPAKSGFSGCRFFPERYSTDVSNVCLNLFVNIGTKSVSTESTTSQILEAAGEVFAEKGFKDATVREICGRAAVNLAAINYHFGDKEHLYLESVKNARRLIEQDVPMPEWSETTTPDEKLESFVFTLVRRLFNPRSPAWQYRLILREIMEPSKACEEMVHESFAPIMDRLRQIINEMTGDSLEQHQLQQLCFSVIGQCVYYRANERVVGMVVSPSEREKYYRPDSLAAHIAKFSTAAIRSFVPSATPQKS